MLIKLLLVTSVLITLSYSSVIISKDFGELLHRLPSNVKPSYYDLRIKIDVDESKFEGNVRIDIEIFEPSKVISINYKDIDVAWKDVVLTEKNSLSEEYIFDVVELLEEYEMAYIHFVDPIPEGFYSMLLSFSGNIRNDLKGLYKSTYDANKFIATTHFEPSYARMVFPCFDEPHLKGIFKITVLHDEKYTALSNMREASTVGPGEEENGFKITTFIETPLMSTYLVAFIVSDYERHGTETDLYVGYAPPGKAAHTNDSIQFAPKAMKALEEFLGVEYQLKLTQLASINDFLFGAMENWGLVTFRSEYLLYPDWYISPRIHQHSRLLISHEFAHMWFGNEVTPEWWTYVWLSEGFAQFFQYYTTDELEPTWRIWEQFNVNNLQSALSQDDKNNIRSMSEPIIEASGTQFDYIVYAKSSSIIRMFYEIIGKEVFRKALNKYITDNTYGTVVPQNLFDSFQFAIDEANILLPTSFANLFESWSNELGYPVVNANVQTQLKKIVVSQTRFFIDPDLMTISKKGKYYIPITVATINNADSYEVHWLLPNNESISIDFVDNDKFTILNKLQAGYYRVNYNKDYWLYLADFLSYEGNVTQISEENRAQLIDDASNLAKAGLVSYEILFKLLHNLAHDIGFLPWMAASNTLSFLTRMLLGSQQFGRFENFLRIITNKTYETYNIDVTYEKHVERLHRLNSVAWACQYGHKECVKDVQNIVSTYIPNIHAQFADEIRPTIFCTFARYSNLRDELLLSNITNILQSPNDIPFAQLNEIVTGIGCTRDIYIIESLLDEIMLIQSSEIRTRLAVALINGSYEAVEIMIRLLSDNFSNFQVLYDPAGITSILNALGSRIVTEEVANALKDFVIKYDTQLKTVPSMYDAAGKARTVAAENVKWRQTYGEEIEEWLQNNIDDLEIENEPSISSIFVLSKAVLFMTIAAMLRQFL